MRAELTGKRFTRLLVEEFAYSKNGSAHWRCLCDCGKYVYVATGNLNKGSTVSCGCLREERRLAACRKDLGESAFNKLVRVYKSNAFKRNLDFQLSLEEFRMLTKQNCFYCNEPPKNIILLEGGYGSYTYNGIDRKDNTIGYVAQNCVACCKICNKAKSDMTMKEFISWLNKVFTYQHVLTG